MSFKTQVFPGTSYARDAADVISRALTEANSLVLTGGTTAEKVYAELAPRVGWPRLTVLFSDERCVAPGDPASNYGMAERLLFAREAPRTVHRMPGEDPPEHGADRYHATIEPAVAQGLDVALLGMGADAHVCAMFPGSRATDETHKLCVAVDRPDGMKGLTLTPPAVLSARKILLIVAGEGKAATVKRVIDGGEGPSSAPARILAAHDDVTFLLDEGAASEL